MDIAEDLKGRGKNFWGWNSGDTVEIYIINL